VHCGRSMESGTAMILGRPAFLAVEAGVLATTLLAPHPLSAAPAHEALVIGNGTYTALPPLPGCLLSAHAVSAALHNAGFTVVEHEDATSGATDAAIGEASRGLTAAPGATAFVYVCGYATALNERTFLLPTSANITRPTDVLTQGVLLRSLLEMLSRGGAGSAVVALDIVPAPGAPAALGLDGALQGTLPDGLGSIAVTQATPPDGPTPLAAALVANLKAATVPAGSLLTAVQQQLSASKAVTVAAIHLPPGQAYLVGGPEPAPAAPPPPTHTAASPAPAPPAPAAPPAPTATTSEAPPPAEPAASPSASAAALPDDAQMTDADRRRVQTALARLGYYDGQVDGIFGPDTRAAIRRFQHELHATMTGMLTAAQATRLAGGT
jgi:Putative peptidoglycan binding domain/Caspase domain